MVAFTSEDSVIKDCLLSHPLFNYLIENDSPLNSPPSFPGPDSIPPGLEDELENYNVYGRHPSTTRCGCAAGSSQYCWRAKVVIMAFMQQEV